MAETKTTLLSVYLIDVLNHYFQLLITIQTLAPPLHEPAQQRMRKFRIPRFNWKQSMLSLFVFQLFHDHNARFLIGTKCICTWIAFHLLLWLYSGYCTCWLPVWMLKALVHSC